MDGDTGIQGLSIWLQNLQVSVWNTELGLIFHLLEYWNVCVYMHVNVHPIETTVCKICGNIASQANFSIHYNNTEILRLLQNLCGITFSCRINDDTASMCIIAMFFISLVFIMT